MGIAADKPCTPSQLALAWNVEQPGITAAIAGPRTRDQLIDNLGALAVTVTAEDHARLDAVAPPLSASPSWEPDPRGWPAPIGWR